MVDSKIDSTSGELLAKWYLRFNGYFTVDNFIIHAADDISKISKDIIGNHTETDLLGIRNKSSKEITGRLQIQNDKKIADQGESMVDFVIVEVKTGKTNKPNSIWIKKNLSAIEYIIRFAGIAASDSEITHAAKEIAENGFWQHPEKKYSIRLILISEEPAGKNWVHLTNILFDDIIEFLVDIRGKCWLEENIGIASVHLQWDQLINQIFKIANDHTLHPDGQKHKIKLLLQ